MKRLILLLLGFVFLGLGAIGVLLPIWPTTPFVLLSAACFVSSPHIKSKIMRIRFFREHIENYENRTGLSPKTVWISLGWLWSMLCISMLVTKELRLIALLIFIGVAVTIHILWMARRQL